MTEPAHPPPTRRAWLLLAVGVAAGVLMVPVAHDLAHLPPITGRRWMSGAQRAAADHRAARDLAVWWLLFAAAAAALVRSPRAAAVAVALVFGAAIPIAAFAHRAPLSNDLYRYAWDARVQSHGIDPYRYPPDSAVLDRLHTSWLWPDAGGCAQLGQAPGCVRINRKEQRTIYPPVAQSWFAVVAAAVPNSAQDTGWEAAGLLLDAAVTVALLIALRGPRRDPRTIAWWTLCPVVPVEAVQNGHVDALAALAIVPAVALARRHRTVAAAATGAGAVLAKLYPALLLPALIRRRPLLGATVAIACVAAAYAPHVLAVGPRVLGYLPGYLREEGYTTGTRFLLLGAVGVPTRASETVAALLLALAVAAASRHRDPALVAGAALVAAFLLATPAEPWYALTLVPLAVLARRPEWLVVAAAGYPPYIAIQVGAHAHGWGVASFAVAAAGCAVAAIARRARHRRASGTLYSIGEPG